MGIEIQSPGALTTVQDLGRLGYQACGVSPAGALDRRSAVLANILVGNEPGEGLLEMTLGGVSMVFREDNTVAVCGAPMPMTLDGVPTEPYRAFTVRAGQVLSFQYAPRGMRTYIAFAGGLDIPPVMGSRSTHISSGVGGFEGRKLRRGDTIGFRSPCLCLPRQQLRRVPPEHFPKAGETVEIRLLTGPQEDYFTPAGQAALFQNPYEISVHSDRMGYRLAGEPIEHKAMGEVITDGVVFGSVQVPPSGQPIIMMADRQTTGGYAKIATVITEDLPLLAQCPPGTLLRFSGVTVEQAQKLCVERRKTMNSLIRQMRQGQDSRCYRVCVNGIDYLVEISAENEMQPAGTN